ncbi:MAG: glutamate-1-semialdehyde 2,1-aminomutase [Planctomycetota bacterium]
MDTALSSLVFEAARQLMPGGVNSPVRAYASVGGVPPHIARGAGPLVTDIDGNEYVDFVMSYGPLIAGHAHPHVVEALEHAIRKGTAFGAPTEGELALARQVTDRVPAVQMVRLVNSGTEATMSALRLARAATGRDLFIKFNGCYHGHGDSFLVKAGSGALTHGAPDSPGVPQALAALTLVAEYNDLESVERLFAQHRGEIACVFVEPVAGNIGCVLPADGFLEGLRDLCDAHEALLVFDEVMTGFRVARGGYQEICGVFPDLVTLGKVIGGGLPIGAYGGRADLMQRVSPAGDVYQAGTLSGNPIAVAAGLATLAVTDEPEFYEKLEASAAELASGITAAARKHGVPLVVNRQGSMLCPYFATEPVTSLERVMRTDRVRWTMFFHALLERGVIVPPSPFEAWFVSSAHDDRIVARAVDAIGAALSTV